MTLTPPQLAKLWRVTPEKVIGWIRAGELPAFNVAVKVGGRPRWRITPEGIKEFEARRSISKPKPVPVKPVPKPSPKPVTEYV